MSRSDSLIRQIDWLTVALFFFLAVFGWMNVFGASYTFDQTSVFSFDYRSGKQLVWMGTALLLGGFILLLDARIFNMAAYVLYAVMIVVLLVTPFIAHDIKGSLSWIALGPVRLQPAEFAKGVTALALAKYMSSYEYRLRSWRDMIVPALLIVVPMAIIMVMQKETGSALVLTSFVLMFYRQGMSGLVLLLGIAAVLLFIIVIKWGVLPADILIGVGLIIAIVRIYFFTDRRRKRMSSLNATLIALLIAGLAAAYCHTCSFAFEHVLQDHQRKRIEVLLHLREDPQGAGYNVTQSLIAIGSGGLTGKGFLNGTQTKMNFVPEQATDFIFCTVGEEWGFLGSAGLLILYAAAILRLIFLAERQRERFAQIYAYCVVGIFIFHLAVNVGMVLGLMPVIGIPLPFISYGGSSMWGFTILLAILLRLDAARGNRDARR